MSSSLPLVLSDELLGLHEHARRAAAGVIDTSLVWLEHLDQQSYDGAWGVEFSALLALGARELGEEVLVDVAQDVLGAALAVADGYVAYEVDDLAETLFIEGGASVVFGQYTV